MKVVCPPAAVSRHIEIEHANPVPLLAVVSEVVAGADRELAAGGFPGAEINHNNVLVIWLVMVTFSRGSTIAVLKRLPWPAAGLRRVLPSWINTSG